MLSRERWLPALIALGGIGLWEMAARSGWISDLFFPPPLTIAMTLLHLSETGKLWSALAATLARLALGVMLGGGVGLVLGWIMGARRGWRIALTPFVAAFHPLPKVAIFPLFLILLGIGESSKIALVALTAFFPMLINTLAGVQQIDRLYWEVARNYGATHHHLLTRVLLPGSLPMALAGLRLAVNSALIVTIAIEMLSAREGLGALIWLAWQRLQTDELYATLFVIVILGLIFGFAMASLQRMLLPWWKPETL